MAKLCVIANFAARLDYFGNTGLVIRAEKRCSVGNYNILARIFGIYHRRICAVKFYYFGFDVFSADIGGCVHMRN